MMKKLYSFIVAFLILTCATVSFGAVTPEEAKKLGTTLTAIGAEKAGNADGSIPAYTGGLTTPPASFKPGSGIRPDPFANEKRLFSITAQNMNQYADKLTEMQKALLKLYPTFRMDVYPTHRTVALPKYVEDATAKNALTGRTTHGGLSVENVSSGIPFPIPKDGYEAMWNHLLHYNGENFVAEASIWLVDSLGRKTLSTKVQPQEEALPYYYRKNPSTKIYWMMKARYTEPPRRNGEALLGIDPLDMAGKGRSVWQYLPGQRRVKQAPDVSFDGPDAAFSGTNCFDDHSGFNGSMERYNWKLIGKKEKYIAYNAYKATYESKIEDVLKPKHVNPDLVRWELHRVWVVEATLKPGKRHIYHRRVFYIDEDSWAIMATDKYDARGQLFRGEFPLMVPSYDVSAPYSACRISYDLIAGSYNAITMAGGFWKYPPPRPNTYWSPESLVSGGAR